MPFGIINKMKIVVSFSGGKDIGSESGIVGKIETDILNRPGRAHHTQCKAQKKSITTQKHSCT